MPQYLVQMTHKFGKPVVVKMAMGQAEKLDKLFDACYPEGTGRGFVIQLPIVPAYVERTIRENRPTRRELEDLFIPLLPGGNTLAAYDAVIDYFYNKFLIED